MSWQEDLQQLDTALAAGQISADDYRRRRDELLAKASGELAGQQAPQAPHPSTPPPGMPVQPSTPPPGFAAQPSTPPPGFAAQPSTPPPGFAAQQAPQAPQSGQDYFPPPFRWQAVPPQQQQPSYTGEETQTMRPVGQPDAERTQVVPGSPGTGERTQMLQGRPGDPTQVVQGGQNAGGYGAQYYTDTPGRQQGQERTPWGGSEFLPLGAAGSWGVKQGPEVFETGGNGKGRRIITIVAAVVVLALIGGGIWFFTTQRGGGNNQAQGGGPATTTTTTTRPKPKPTPVHPDEPLLDQVPPVVGTVSPHSEVVNVPDLVQKHVTDQTVVGLLTQAGVQQVVWRTGSKAPDQYGPTSDYFSVVAIPLNDANSADSLARQIQHYQDIGGFTHLSQPVPGVPSSILVEKNGSPGETIYRALWSCGPDVIWLSVDQQPTTNVQALAQSLEREVVSLTQSFPAQ